MDAEKLLNDKYRMTLAAGRTGLTGWSGSIYDRPDRRGPLGLPLMQAFKDTGYKPSMNGKDIREHTGQPVKYPEHPCLYWGRRFLHDLGLREWELGRPKIALGPQFQDLWFLYWVVRDNRPRIVLEYGVGHSSVIMALACFHNQCGGIQSIDSDARWIASVANDFPPELRSLWAIMRSEVISRELDGRLVMQYLRTPVDDDHIPDIIYIDAPDLYKGSGPHHDGIVDPFYYEHKLKPGCIIIVDGRVNQVVLCSNHLKRNWKLYAREEYDQHFLILQPD